MEHIWDEDRGTVTEASEEGDFIELARYKHGKVYFLMIEDKLTGKKSVGWVDEFNFNEVYGVIGYKRSDFIELRNEDIIELIDRL